MTTVTERPDGKPKSIIEMATEFCEEGELAPLIGQAPFGKIKKDVLDSAQIFLEEETEETREALKKLVGLTVKSEIEPLLEEILDGFGDVAFVALNGIYKTLRLLCDQNPADARVYTERVMKRICIANLNKRFEDGKFHHQGPNDKIPGKIIKPDGWQEPVFNDMLNSKEGES